jgi:hypothetical protein
MKDVEFPCSVLTCWPPFFLFEIDRYFLATINFEQVNWMLDSSPSPDLPKVSK